MLTKTIRQQLETIRLEGKTNMFAVNEVQRLAFENGFYELVCFIDEHRKEYVNFILCGKED